MEREIMIAVPASLVRRAILAFSKVSTEVGSDEQMRWRADQDCGALFRILEEAFIRFGSLPGQCEREAEAQSAMHASGEPGAAGAKIVSMNSQPRSIEQEKQEE